MSAFGKKIVKLEFWRCLGQTLEKNEGGVWQFLPEGTLVQVDIGRTWFQVLCKDCTVCLFVCLLFWYISIIDKVLHVTI